MERRDTTGTVRTVKSVLHAVVKPHFTIEQDEQGVLRGRVADFTHHIHVPVRGFEPARGWQRIKLLLAQQKLMYRGVFQLHHAHAPANAVTHGFRVERVTLASVKSGPQHDLVALAQPHRAFPR